MRPATKKLSEILRNGDHSALEKSWDSTKPADDFAPLPAGEYVAHIVAGECFRANTKGTLGFKLTFKIIEGEHAGRLVWQDFWLTDAALPMTKRDLGKFGITSLDQLGSPLPQGIRCRLRIVLRKEDDGSEYNRVRLSEFVGIDAPEADPFAPVDNERGEI